MDRCISSRYFTKIAIRHFCILHFAFCILPLSPLAGARIRRFAGKYAFLGARIRVFIAFEICFHP